ncbi:MAG TPA: HepT-like ribonuclease domain-containing protein [Isosphaeraceae bacterium]|nr:HepT-like ribonuclease domain-containing protein [Isosphaeraceae bacterium]
MSPDLKTLVILRDAARALIDHAAGHTRDSFEADRKTRSAVLFEIILMGEAIKRLSPDLLARYPEVPWSQVVRMRDRLAHSFDTIRFDIVWDVIQVHASALLGDLDRILAQEANP